MFEYKGWITLSSDPYEEDFFRLKEQVAFLEKKISNFNSSSQFSKIINCNEDYTMALIGVLNHENGIIEELKSLLHHIAEVLPASFGVIYYRDQGGNYENHYFVIRLAKGKLEEYNDHILSPCFPIIED